MAYIVELEPGCWITHSLRTNLEETTSRPLAALFTTPGKAQLALRAIQQTNGTRSHRTYRNAKIREVK